MFNIHPTIFLISLQMVHVLCAGGNSQNTHARKSSQATPSDTRITLPLTLIAYGYSYDNPTKLDKAIWSKGNKALLEGTTFSREFAGKMTFLCAIRPPTSKENPDSLKTPEDSQNQYCSYHIKFKSKETLQCVNDAEPFVEKLDISASPNPPTEFPCGLGNRGKMYWFGYEICSTEKNIENKKLLRSDFSSLKVNPIKHRSRFEIYRFCYDEQANEVIYTLHQIKAPGLLEDENMKNEREKEYEMFTEGYNIFDSKFEIMRQKYADITDLRNEEQTIASLNSSKPPYELQKLVLPEDFSFAYGKKPAYHYLNTKLMHVELVPLWDHINNLIRQDSIKKQRNYSLYTGAFNKVENLVSTNPEDPLEPPDIWLKVIRYFYVDTDRMGYYKSLAIIFDNTFKDTPDNTSFKEDCRENLCKGAFTKSFPKAGQYVRCCQVTDNIISYFDKNLKAHYYLDPYFLFDQ